MTNTSKRVGVGLISAGWMGTVHSRGYRALPEKYPDLGIEPDLVIVADPIEANAQRAMQSNGYREATADVQKVLEHPDVDVVSICSPNYLHREFALAAAAAGKPFWIEKPVGTGLADTQAIADVVEDAGLITCVGFNYRHIPAVEYVRKLVRDGTLGQVRNLHVKLNADYSSSPQGPLTWRYVRERAGSGVLGDLLSHGFDLAQYLAGAITEVTSTTGTFITERPKPAPGGVGHAVEAAADGEMLTVENEDYAAVLARFAGGAVGTLESSRVALGSRCDYGFEVYGSLGSARWNFERMNELDLCLPTNGAPYGYTRVMSDRTFGEFARFQPGAGMGLSFDDLKAIEAMQFLTSVTSGEQLAPSVADARTAAAVADAAERSSADGQWHTVPAPAGRTTFAS